MPQLFLREGHWLCVSGGDFHPYRCLRRKNGALKPSKDSRAITKINISGVAWTFADCRRISECTQNDQNEHATSENTAAYTGKIKGQPENNPDGRKNGSRDEEYFPCCKARSRILLVLFFGFRSLRNCLGFRQILLQTAVLVFFSAPTGAFVIAFCFHEYLNMSKVSRS